MCVYVPSQKYRPISWCINRWVIGEINQCKENRAHKYYFNMYMFSKVPIFRQKTKPYFHIYFGKCIFFIINITHPNEQTLEFKTTSEFNRQQERSMDPRKSWKPPLDDLVTSKGEAQLQVRPSPPSQPWTVQRGEHPVDAWHWHQAQQQPSSSPAAAQTVPLCCLRLGTRSLQWKSCEQ